MTESVSVPAFDFTDFDRSVRVQDDLYRHVNGQWLATTEIPDDKPLTGAFIELRDASEEAVREIITTLSGAEPGTEEAKIAHLYASFMDVDSIEAAGAEPLRESLAEVDAIDSIEALMRLIGSFARRSVGGLIGFDAESDPGDPTRQVMFVAQGGLGLPDEEYYREEKYADIRAEYLAHVTTTLELAGFEDAAEQASAVVDLETRIAAHHWDKVRTRDLREMYNLQTADEFFAASPGLHFDAFLDGAAVPAAAMAEVVNTQPSFFTEVAGLLSEAELGSWRSWARWKLVSSMSPYLSEAFVNERFRFYGTVLAGTPVLKERWKRGVDLVEGALGEAVGKIYVERHFSPTAKKRMDELVANLVEAYRQSITDLDWMTEDTKAKALDKLGKFTPKIGFPSTWRDYGSLEITSDDLIGNVMRATSFEVDYEISKIGKEVDREEWLMTPQTVNAYYHPLRNEIVFPAAILQPPFFNEDADDAVNYGGIGAVIGHEIGHGFDDQGSTCDGDGRLIDWWTEADRTAFEQRTRALIEQYNALSPEQTPGQHVNGDLTIGENIGDLGGLSIAYKAWRISLDGTEPEPVDDLTGAQRLFLSWAAVWQNKSRDEMVRQRLATDPHSPPEFRCNQIVRNVPEFYDAFDLTSSDALWLDEEQRVKIW
ncbi:MAG: M13 family metallopeptidase [Propionibacteriaceae bacterium]